MKTLVLVRHAKSDWDDPALSDHDRPLSERGLRDAPIMGRRLREHELMPDAILSSSAVRARSTAGILAAELGFDAGRISVLERLYGADPETILELVTAEDDALGTVMVVAHDPGLSELAWALSHSIDGMPTCAVAEFDFDVEDWAAVPRADAVAVRFSTPKE